MNIKVVVKDTDFLIGMKDFKKANNQAVLNTLNKAAAVTRSESVKEIRNDFTLRNTFTVRSVVFDKATQKTISEMKSTVGALKRASYLATQEEGGMRRSRARTSERGKIKTNTAIPMKSTRGGLSESRPVSSEYYITKIQKKIVRDSGFKKKGLSPRSRAVAQMFVAHKYGLYLKRNDNIFSVSSFNQTGRNNISVQLNHLYSIHHTPIHIDKETWLEPSYKKASRNLEAVYKWELKKLWTTGKIK